MSPLRYRLHRIKEAVFGDNEIIPEVLINHRYKLPSNIRVSWERDGAFIIGTVVANGEEFFAQGKSAKEFVECVNDAIYATFGIPVKYAEALGDYRLMPPKAEFERLNNQAIKKSNLIFGLEQKVA